MQSAVRNVVLVHGGFVDCSIWEAVYRLLRKDGSTLKGTSYITGGSGLGLRDRQVLAQSLKLLGALYDGPRTVTTRGRAFTDPE